MSGKFVRASKFRHVYGQPFKKELCYENLKPTLSAFDSNIIQCNGVYLALNANGIGSFTVIPVDEVGKAPDKVPMFRGHTGGSVLDTAFDPFDQRRVLSSGEDGKILIWEIPEDYSYVNVDPENIVDVQPQGALVGHVRKVGHLQFHPCAKDVLASSSFDYSVKIWDVAEKKCMVTLQHKDLITSFCFSYNGSKIATASRDKKIRVWDTRSGELLSEGPGHVGAKACRVLWLGNTNRLVTTGFDRFSERQVGLWDSDDVAKGPLGGFISIDSSSGTLMPFFDPSTNLLFVAGKGDGNVRYFEFADDDLHLLSEYPSTEAQRGFAVAPKRYVNVKENELVRAYKLLNDNSIEPLSFIVPRRSEMFQEDIYPDAPADKPAMTAEEFFAGKTVDGPILCSMRDIYEGVTSPALSESQPPQQVKKEEPKPESTPAEPKLETPTTASSLTPTAKEEHKEEPRAVFSHSQEQGVENMLNEKGVNKLLDKVNTLSDDDTQDVEVDADNDYEWADKKSASTTPLTTTSSASAPVSSANAEPEEEEPKVEPKKVEPKKEEPKVQTKVETKGEPKADSEAKAEAKVESSHVPSASTTAKAGAATTGLKANLDRLHQLVNTLEANVEKLTLANQAKDEKLQTLEAKIDLLLKK